VSPDKPKGNYIGQAWLVILLALLYGGGLAGVQTALSQRIADNKRAETYDVIPVLIAGASSERVEELVVTDAKGARTTVYRARAEDGATLGWVLPGSGQGFAGRIELLVGVDAACAAITGLYVLEQTETPGLGDYITTEEWRGQFAGASTDPATPVRVVKRDPSAADEIRALTGATISSESVADTVNRTIATLRPLVLAAASAE
jgi:H+/Na+-translocating ferredoxin:NAD+ oxidoreductase subunit G